MKAFLDINVLIDFLAERHPHYHASAVLFELAKQGLLSLTYSSLTVANAFYILRREYRAEQLCTVFERQRNIAEICGISSSDTDCDIPVMTQTDFLDKYFS